MSIDLDQVLEIIGNELDGKLERIELGYIAFHKKDRKAYAGGQYSAGAKVYKSEAMAKAALGNRKKFYNFIPVFIDVAFD